MLGLIQQLAQKHMQKRNSSGLGRMANKLGQLKRPDASMPEPRQGLAGLMQRMASKRQSQPMPKRNFGGMNKVSNKFSAEEA